MFGLSFEFACKHLKGHPFDVIHYNKLISV